MKTHVCLLLLALAPLAGCRNKQINNQLVQRELRLQEDRIYELEDMLGEAEMIVEASRRENEALKQELAGGDPGPGPSRSGTNRGAEPSSTPRFPRGGSSSGRPSPETESPNLEAPEVDLGMPEEGGTLEGSGGAPSVEGGELQETLEIDPGEGVPGPAGASAIPADPSDIGPVELLPDDATPISDSSVTKLLINKRLTGGVNRDSHPGDDGLMVVCEPRDEKGELVKAPAEMSLVLIDPSKSGAASRVARWDFKSDETPQHFHKTPLGSGLHFELPWPSSPPSAEKLKLYVRYIGPHGDKVVSEVPIIVDPNGDKRLARRKAALTGPPAKRSASTPRGWAAPRTSSVQPKRGLIGGGGAFSRAEVADKQRPHSRYPVGRRDEGPMTEPEALSDRGQSIVKRDRDAGSNAEVREQPADDRLARRKRSTLDDDSPEREPADEEAAPRRPAGGWQPDRDQPADDQQSADDEGPSLSRRDRGSARERTSTATRPTWRPYR